MTTEENVGILTDKDQIAEETRFQEQCFLIEFIEFFTNQNKTYPNLVQVDGSPPTVLNRLLSSGIEGFFYLTPAQMAILQPKVRLFKTAYDQNGKEYDLELYFDDYTNDSVEKILIGTSGVGLKKIDWEDTGTNPGDSGKAFKATLTLFFKKFSDIFVERTTSSGLSVSFADLIRVPPHRYLLNGIQNDKFFRIKLQVGWAMPPKTDLIDERLQRAIRNSTTTLFLNLIKNTIQIEQNGNVQIIVEYIGAIETKLLSPEMDVLDAGEINDKEVKILENLVQQTRTRLQEQQNKIQQKDEDSSSSGGFIEKASKLRRWVDKASNFFGGTDGFSFVKDDDELIKERLEEDIENYLKQKEDIIRNNRIQAYQKLLSSLEKGQRLFYVDLPYEQIKLFGSKLDKQLSREAAAADRAKRIQEYRETSKLLKSQTNTFEIGVENPSQKTSLFRDISSITSTTDADKREEKIAQVLSGKTRSSSPKGKDNIRINYVFLGDIINAGLDVVFNDARLPSVLRENRRDLFRFLIGAVEFIDPITQNIKRINLTDVPISLNLFHAWFVKKVIRPQLDKYLLRDFLRDLCAELVSTAISPECFGTAVQASKNRVSFSTFSLPISSKDPLCPNSVSGVFGNARTNVDSISVKELENLRANQANLEDFKHYFYIYISGIYPTTLKGEYDEDIKNGIYHFNIGADVGLVKKITFDQANIQYLKESRIVNQDEARKGELFLAEPYNATVVLVGTSIFKPGMTLFINPASIGMGASVPKNKRLPIGGYYSVISVSSFIESGMFQTELFLTWQTDGFGGVNIQTQPSNGFQEKSIDSM